MKKIALIAAGALLLSGCATQTFNLAANSPATPTKEVSQPFFVSGIGQSKEMDAAEVCGGAAKIAKVETKTTGMDVVFGMITAGIYTPRTARVYCK